MSFIPGEGTNVFPLESLNGSGIQLTNVGPTTYVSADLGAGTGITLTPSLVNKTITIAAPAGPAGITSLTSANGSGINAVPILPNSVNLTNALQPGSGISLTPSGVNADLTINNTATLTTPLSSGLVVTGTAPNYAISTAFVGGAGISITNDPNSTQGKLVTNTGVLSLSAGANSGISVSAPTGIVTITNTNPVPVASTTGGGIAVAAGQVVSLDLTGGTGVSVTTGTGTQKQITNTGALSVTAGAGITTSATTGAITLTNNGVRTLAVQAPLQTTGGNNPTLSLGPLTGGLKVSSIFISASMQPSTTIVPGATSRILVGAGVVGNAFYNDFQNATPIADPNGTWVINLSSSLFLVNGNAPASQSVTLAITPATANTPNLPLTNNLYATGTGQQYMTPGTIAFPVNAIKSALGVLTNQTLGLSLTNGFASLNITRSSYNSIVYAVYYPNGIQ